MTEPLFRIVYCSRNSIAAEDGAAVLDEVLRASRHNNAADGVTGALLYNSGIFAQTLEGTFEAVQTVFERIQADPRHDDVVVLQSQAVPARMFADWSMAHAEPDDPAAARATLSRAMKNGDPATASDILDLFGSVVRYTPA